MLVVMVVEVVVER